jgi:Domain of unknown function (DUF4124)
MRTQKLLLLALGCAWAMGASAQWQWVDKDGRKVFSDRPPPQEIPEKDILKQPGGRAAPRAAAPVPAAAPDGTAVATAGGASAARGAASAPKISGTDKELEQKKKQADDAEEAKKKAEEQKVAKARMESCNQAKSAKATMDSGIRVSRANAKGEQEIFDEAARDAETKRLQGIINSQCK